MKTIAFLFLLLVVSSSNANTFYKETGWKLEPDRNGVYTVLPEQGRGGASTSGCTTVSCNRTGGVGGPVGKPRPTLAPTTTFPKGNIAGGALALGSRALPWLSLGYGLYEWYNAAGLQQGENGLMVQPPQDASVRGSGTWTWVGSEDNLGYATAQAACAASLLQFNGAVIAPHASLHPNGFWQCGGWHHAIQWWNPQQFVLAMLPASNCPFGSANSAGECPYNGTPVPISEADARQRLIDAPISADTLRRSFDEVLDAGGGVASTGTTVTGPSSAPGETTTRTSTAANGTTQVSTTTTNYNYTYNDNRVTVTETKTTQNPDGSTETETTDQPKDECARNPEALKCKELGQENGSPTWETKTVLFQAESLGLSGACPAPWVANLRGWNLTMSYQPVCDVAPTVRLGILAITALMCIFVVIRVTQS